MAPLNNPTQQGFGKVLRYYRRMHRLSQEELGSKLGVDQTTISDWEKRSEPPRDFDAELDMIANILYIDPHILISGELNRVLEFTEDDQETTDIRRLAPNTPVEEARALLEDWENLDAQGRRAVLALIDGLRRARNRKVHGLEEKASEG